MTKPIDNILRRLSEHLAGGLSRPGDARYAAANTIWSSVVKRTPHAVAHCRTAPDVRAAIRAARDSGLPLSVRGGGHDWAGRALCDGIVIDMSGKRDVVFRASNQSVRVGGGATASDVVGLTDTLGLAPVAGSVGAVGMAGLTLGGGYGALIGRFGLTLDNLLSAEVVLADGRIVTASEDSEPDLFWALRGGGGNFGVVTGMCHKVHRLPSVQTGLLLYPLSEARTVLKHCAEVSALAPDALTVQVGFAAGPNGPVVIVAPTWCGDREIGEAHLAPFSRLGARHIGKTQVMSYGTSVTLYDSHITDGRRTFVETCSLASLGNRSIDVIADAAQRAVSTGCTLITHEFKGAASKVPVEATAFGLRRDHVVVEILVGCAGTSSDLSVERHRRWAQITRKPFEPLALPGGYPSLLGADDGALVAQSYGPNAGRLLAIKGRYDPENVFASAIPLPRDHGMAALNEKAASY